MPLMSMQASFCSSCCYFCSAGTILDSLSINEPNIVRIDSDYSGAVCRCVHGVQHDSLAGTMTVSFLHERTISIG